MKKIFILFVIILLISACNQKEKPNIVFILADDLGWMDLVSYGATFYETPNIDRLATDGIKFSRAYASNPQCSPTRASIMTGKCPERLKFTYAKNKKAKMKGEPKVLKSGLSNNPCTTVQSNTSLKSEEITIAEKLLENGYRTSFFGKWHLGGEIEDWANYHGFESILGGTGSASPKSNFSPFRIENIKMTKQGVYITDKITYDAGRKLEEYAKSDKPFFLCLWHYAVHYPFEAPSELIEKYKDKRKTNFKYSPTMAAMIEKLDDSVGYILDKLQELGLEENTIVIFTSDNGGNMYSIVDGTAATLNSPLRGGKATIYEGGIRVPQIIKWPGVISPNSTSDYLTSTLDYFPTFMSMAGIEESKAPEGLDGLDLVPLLAGDSTLFEDRHLYCHFPHYPLIQNCYGPSSAIINKEYKLIKYYCQGENGGDRLELYDLNNDIGEKRDLSPWHPIIAGELNQKLDKHLDKVGALIPIKNPQFDPTLKPKKKGISPKLLNYF